MSDVLPEAVPPTGPRSRGLTRSITGLALPALVVLAAEPLYLLFDTAVVGRLGAMSLAGLAIGSVLLGMVGVQFLFFSYGTTARSARQFGAGERALAVTEGVQATWLALAIGALLVVVVEAVAVPLVSAIAGGQQVAGAALPWLRISILAAPAILVSLAGNGWMRGVQDTARPLRYVVAGFGLSALLCPSLVFGWLGLPRLGLAGSAVANLVGQWLAALLFGRALWAERVTLRFNRAVLRAQTVMGRNFILRTLSFQVCFISAAAVAARFGAAAVAAHQILLQLWDFAVLVLDALAVAAQSMVGAALGAGQPAQAKSVARQVTAHSAAAAMLLALVFGLGAPVLPRLFTHDRSVLNEIVVPLWFLIAQLPIQGIVFSLEGVLVGAGDAKFIRNATLISASAGFLPLIWLSLILRWGVAGIWLGLGMFMVVRLALVGWRVFSGRWTVSATS